jgi:hypothetical protein
MGYTWRLASGTGEDFEWHYNEWGPIAFLTEISANSFQPPFAVVQADLAQARPGWQYLLGRLRGPGVEGHVRERFSGKPVPGVRLSLDEVNFLAGEARTTDPKTGRYRWTLLAGATYHLRATAPGFLPALVTLPSLSAGGATVAEIRMVRTLGVPGDPQ